MKQALFLILFITFSLIVAQNNNDKTVEQLEAEQKQKEQQIKQKWVAYASPNENHQSLNFMAGAWKTHSHIYDDKGNIFREDAGTCSNRWILGNRFLLIQHQFTQYGAIGILGYDNYSKKFTAAYLDNQGTGMYSSKGDRQSDGSLVLTGSSISYFTGKPIKAKYIYTINADSGYTFTLLNEDTSIKIIEITYTKSNNEANKSYWTEKAKDVSKKDENSWNKYATPNNFHTALYPLLGDWKVSYHVYDEAGNIIRAPEGHAYNRGILGGRFALLHYKLLNFQGVGIMGYDNIKQTYLSLYIDNSGTGIHFSEGKAGQHNRFLLLGDSIDYATGKQANVVYDTTVINSNEYSFQLYDKKDKEELNVKKVHIVCNRIAMVKPVKIPKAEPKVPVTVKPEEVKEAKEEVKAVKEEAKKEVKEVKEEVKEAKEEVKEAKEEVKEAKEKVKEAKEEVKEAKEEVKEIKEKADEIKKEVRKEIKNIIEKAKEEAKEIKEKAKEEAKEIKEEAKEEAEEIKEEAKEAKEIKEDSGK